MGFWSWCKSMAVVLSKIKWWKKLSFLSRTPIPFFRNASQMAQYHFARPLYKELPKCLFIWHASICFVAVAAANISVPNWEHGRENNPWESWSLFTTWSFPPRTGSPCRSLSTRVRRTVHRRPGLPGHRLWRTSHRPALQPRASESCWHRVGRGTSERCWKARKSP